MCPSHQCENPSFTLAVTAEPGRFRTPHPFPKAPLPHRTSQKAVCRCRAQGSPGKAAKGSDGVTEHCRLSRQRGDSAPSQGGQGQEARAGVGGQAKGRGEGRGPHSGAHRAPAQTHEPALSLSGHGTAGPGAEASARAAVAAAAGTATGAARDALPRALQLPSGRRAALPWPAGRPHPTVSTRRLPPGFFSRSGHLSYLLVAPLYLPGSLGKDARPCQTPPPFRAMRSQSLGAVFTIPGAPRIWAPPAGAPSSP